MEGILVSKWLLKLLFLMFLAAGAWQDMRKHSISLITFQLAGVSGVLIRLGIVVLMTMSGEVSGGGSENYGFMQALFEMAVSVLPGIGLLILSSATDEAVGRGDGSFFIVSGIYLGFWKNVILLWGSLFLCFPVCMALMIRGIQRGKRLSCMRIPFLPFVLPVGIGVMLL